MKTLNASLYGYHKCCGLSGHVLAPCSGSYPPFPLTFVATETKYPYSVSLTALDLVFICNVSAAFAPLIEWEIHLLRKIGIPDDDVRSYRSSGRLRDVPLYAICVFTTHTTQVVRE